MTTFTDAESLRRSTQLCRTPLDALNGILEKASDLSIPTSSVTLGPSFSGDGVAVAGTAGTTGGRVGCVGLLARLPDWAVAMNVKLNSKPAAKSDARIFSDLDFFIMVSIAGNYVIAEEWPALYHLPGPN